MMIWVVLLPLFPKETHHIRICAEPPTPSFHTSPRRHAAILTQPNSAFYYLTSSPTFSKQTDGRKREWLPSEKLRSEYGNYLRLLLLLLWKEGEIKITENNWTEPLEAQRLPSQIRALIYLFRRTGSFAALPYLYITRVFFFSQFSTLNGLVVSTT